MSKKTITFLFVAFAFFAMVSFMSAPSASAFGDSQSGGCCGGGGGGSTPKPTPKPTPDHDNGPTPVYPVCVITATPASITTGANSTLKWTTTRATSASINQSIGAVAIGTDVTKVVSPTGNVTYTMTVKSSTGHTSSCATTVTVTPVSVPAPECVINANPSTINRGDNSTLTWTTTNAITASINQSVGSVEIGSNKTRVVSPTSNTTYTMIVTNSAGVTATCAAPITVIQPTTAITCAANVNFSASPTTINRGNSSTLTWSTNGLTSVSIDNGVNASAFNGSAAVTPTNSTTYTLIGKKGNETINCPVSITVNQPSTGGGGGSSPTPRCELKISDKSIAAGERVTLTWKTSNATAVSLEDNHGKTLVDTAGKSSSDKKKLYDGEITIRPEKDTTYTLLAERGSRDRKCTVSVDVKDGITVLQVRDQQPLVTGIALTQVPYTGFEAGTFMTVMFYTLLALFALYLAYIFGVRPRLAGAVATVTNPSVFTPAASVFAAATTATPNFHAPRVESFSTTAATVGYAAAVATEVTGIEAQAHAAGVLLSADALAHIASITDTANVNEVSAALFALAKESFPTEDGYVTLTNDRLATLIG